MQQFVAIAAAFLLLPLWPKKKAGFGPALCLTAIYIALIAGIPYLQIWHNFTSVFTQKSTLSSLTVIALVGVLGNVLKEYGILDRVVQNLEVLFRSKKTIIMVLPAVIGLLSVPGGAMLSAPFVLRLGEEMGLPPARRAVINLSFRHIAMFIMPYSTALLLIPSIVSDIKIYHLILLNIGFVLWMQITAYLAYLRGVKCPKTPRQQGRGRALCSLLYNLSPVYMIVVCNALFGLEMPYCVAICIGIALLIGTRKQIFHVLWRGVNLKNIAMVIGVYFIQYTIKNLDQVQAICIDLFTRSSGIMVLLVIAGCALLFGLSTGLNLLAVTVILPLIAGLSIGPMERLCYTFFVLVWAFLGYFYSPLHLCQLLTLKQMGCTQMQAYREHLRAAPFIMVGSFVLFYLYWWILV